jgi:hypothetical protein
MSTWMRLALAFVIFCHAFIYIRVGATLPGAVKEWQGRSWLLGSRVSGASLATLVLVMHVMAGVLIMACALAMGLAPSAPGWWPALAVAGGALGIAAFAVFWDGQPRRLFEEGGIGAAVSAVLLATALLFPAAFR